MSLRLRAVLITGIALMVLWATAAAWMMQGMRANLDRTLDGRLAMSARMVAGLLEGAALDPTASPVNFTEAVRISGKEGIACEIRALRGEVLASTGSVPSSDFATLPTGYSTREMQGKQWRIYILHDNGYQITTADRIDERNVLINDLLGAAGVPFLIAFLGGLAALWIGIGRGLAPLETLREQLRARKTDDITPVVVDRSPTELRPVLDAMNGLLGRLAQALASQRAFTDAAAHELRTPLTVIDTHLQVVRLSDKEEAQASLAGAEEGVRRLRRILDQMMTLARTEAVISKGDECTSVLEAVHGVLNQVSEAKRSRLTLSVAGADTGTPMPRSMLETALRNLVNNALRYSPDCTTIEVTASFDHSAQRCVLSVADQGPGLSPEQVSQMGRRFWRGDQGRGHQDGAGLGISIVRAIAARFGGTLDLKPRAEGGLIAEIMIPLSAATKT
ncbi:ATP-binding protein [Halopseudomonas bauzanensis]|uniref:histidine kinase n=1 Tax=Halopseudomonas bauzanensis TaxID=653930 RepID=A0A1H9VYJ7_9GAMM|nr:ATP-binding protein [Halopseudomonas bauzanensis]SES26725.1 two-component system, OmpR family, sensor histidine kinase QseC [Halopseudomonas bauzanensis]SFM23495.1 two-component system, OmpR family, sensor histidine kinase QseC [Halopseudomonas bauzanensis]